MRRTCLPNPEAGPSQHDQEVGAEEEAAGEGGEDVAHCHLDQTGVLGVDGDVDLGRKAEGRGRKGEREDGSSSSYDRE